MSLKAFQPAVIAGLSLKNRIVMSPMTRRGATAKDGIPNLEIVNYYTRRSQGDVGLIISEGIHIDDTHSVDDFNTPRMHNEKQAEGWLNVTNSVHKYGGRFVAQLWHTGRYAIDPIAPTAVKMDDPRSLNTPKEMNPSHFKEVKEKYVRSAILAEKAGCDAIELHGAHGYLLDSFLCPTNTRTDGYGQSIENRLKFPFEVVGEVKRAIKIPVIFRFSQWGWLGDYKYKKFPTSQELRIVIETLDKAGVDIFHASTYRVAEPGFANEDKSLSLGGWVKKFTRKPVIGVGGVNCSIDLVQMRLNPENKQKLIDANKELGLVEKGEIDLLAVGRSLIANPNWVQLVQSGQQDKLIPFDKVMLGRLE